MNKNYIIVNYLFFYKVDPPISDSINFKLSFTIHEIGKDLFVPENQVSSDIDTWGLIVDDECLRFINHIKQEIVSTGYREIVKHIDKATLTIYSYIGRERMYTLTIANDKESEEIMFSPWSIVRE